MNNIKFIKTLIILVIIYYLYIFRINPSKQYIIKTFDINNHIHSEWKHNWNIPTGGQWRKKNGTSMPFVGASIFKDGGVEYLYVGGSKNQLDSLLLYNPKTKIFDNYINKTNIPELDKNNKHATYSIVSLDLNKDKWNDLIIARQNGLFLYKNQGKKNGIIQFKKQILLKDNKKSFPMSITVGDYNKDGKDDLYISKFLKPKFLDNFQFNNEDAKAYNIMLKNISNKQNTIFKDTTKETQTKGVHNTFGSIFADIDGDKQPDLIISNDTNVVEILKNDNGVFKRINDDKLSNYGMWMGLDISDIDNDGDFDIFFTNVGSNVPEFIYQSSLIGNQKANSNHLLLKNDGNMKFSDIGKRRNISDESFGWGGVFQNINYDIYDDLLFANNYVDLPLSKNDIGYVGIYDLKTNKYKRLMKYLNPLFGNSNIRYDFNKDGRDDIVWINMNNKVLAYINNSSNDFINIEMPPITKYNNSIIKVYLNNGKILTKQFLVSGSGFLTDHSSILSFGLGKNNKIKKITIDNIYDNNIITIKKPNNNSTIKIKN